MTEINAQTENATRLIDHLVTAARDAQMELGTSHCAARQMALREAAQSIREEQSNLLAANRRDLVAAVELVKDPRCWCVPFVALLPYGWAIASRRRQKTTTTEDDSSQ